MNRNWGRAHSAEGTNGAGKIVACLQNRKKKKKKRERKKSDEVSAGSERTMVEVQWVRWAKGHCVRRMLLAMVRCLECLVSAVGDH